MNAKIEAAGHRVAARFSHDWTSVKQQPGQACHGTGKKSIIITGASGATGAAAVEPFASEGANIFLGAGRSAEFQSLASAINRHNGNAVFLAGDVRDERYCDALVDLAPGDFGALDGHSTAPA